MTDIQAALDNDDWPTIKEEIERKLVQTLEKWLGKHTEGVISDRELVIVTSALWDVASGITTEPSLRLVEAVNKEARENAKARSAVRGVPRRAGG